VGQLRRVELAEALAVEEDLAEVARVLRALIGGKDVDATLHRETARRHREAAQDLAAFPGRVGFGLERILLRLLAAADQGGDEEGGDSGPHSLPRMLREMTSRWISEVPSPISQILASR